MLICQPIGLLRQKNNQSRVDNIQLLIFVEVNIIQLMTFDEVDTRIY
jgi:hypothetical protein